MRNPFYLSLFLVGLLLLIQIPPRGSSSLAAQQDRSSGERRRMERIPIELASGARVEFSAFPSAALKEDREFSIYLPPSYAKKGGNYPVVYFLHGLNNDHTSWTVDRYGQIQDQVDKLIAEKKIPEILMVHPKGDNSFYTNYVDGSRNYEDFITSDLIQHIVRTYRAKGDGRWRTIRGT